MADIAALNLAVNSDSVKAATVELKALGQTATAAEKATKQFGLSTDAASASNDNFSRRTRRTVDDLEFQRKQLTRNAAEQEKYSVLKRAGVAADSAAGQAILASVTALQAQRAATKSAADSHGVLGAATKAAGNATGELVSHLKYLALAYISVEGAMKLWETAMKAGDLGEQAEQVGVNTDQLQAYRLAGAQAGIETEQMDAAITKLQRAMGSAAGGNKDMIELFDKLGVKVLDANDELRSAGDTLPEFARGLLKVESSSQRTADMMTLFGKSGARMSTVLGDLAKGNDALIASAREQNAIISPSAIEAWDKLGDRLKVAAQQFKTFVANNGEPIATAGFDLLIWKAKVLAESMGLILNTWQSIKKMSADATANAPVAAAQNDEKALQDRLAALRQNPSQFGFAASEKALMDQLAARRAATTAAESQVQFGQQGALQASGVPSAGVSSVLPQKPLGAESTGKAGVSNPVPKDQVEGYAKIIASAKAYVLQKKAEADAVGLSVEAAARMTHEQDLQNKATEAKIALGPAQLQQIKELAIAMAAADNALKTAKFMDDFNKSTEQAIATQQIEMDTLFMSTEAAMAYRIEHEQLNKALADGIILTDAQKQKIADLAGAQAAATEKTRQMKELVDLGRETFQGFFSDIAQGLQQGKSAWDAFGTAATNALSKIANKLLEMAAQKLFESAFGGSSGAGGGFLDGVFRSIAGAFTGGVAGAGTPGSPYYGPPASAAPSAMGNVFSQGNIVPFRRGGIIGHPTLFRMANGGTGLAGEAGPEGIVPLRRASNGRLGVDASGMGGGDVYVNIVNTTDSTVTAKKSKGPGGQMQVDVIVEAVEGKMSGRLSRGQGSLGRTMEGTYGLQRKGR